MSVDLRKKVEDKLAALEIYRNSHGDPTGVLSSTLQTLREARDLLSDREPDGWVDADWREHLDAGDEAHLWPRVESWMRAPMCPVYIGSPVQPTTGSTRRRRVRGPRSFAEGLRAMLPEQPDES